jgi:hypothetical protein
MRTHAFDAVTRRHAAGVSRRSSVLTLGGAALAAAIATPELSHAKKKKGKDCKKKEKQRCSNDIEACETTINLSCNDPAGCPEALLCCQSCSAEGFFECLIAASQP